MRTKLSVFAEKVLEAGWLAALVVVPLFFNIYSARTFEPDKITLLRSITMVMILAWVVWVVEQGLDRFINKPDSGGEMIGRWLKQPLVLPTLLLVLVYIISTIFSLSPKVSLWGSYQRMQGTYSTLSYIVIFALMAGHLRTREQANRLVTTIIIASIPVSLYGIVQHYGLDPLPWAGDVTRRVAANMGNAIFVASYLIMIVPLTLSRLVESMTAIIKEEESSWTQTILAAVYIFSLAVQVITILFSQSRGPMLGILGAGFVMGLLVLLILRQLSTDKSALSLTEIASSFLFLMLLGLSGGLGGGAGFLLGLGINKLLVGLNYQVESLALLGAAIGGLLGFLGLYTYMATANRGWRWLWLSWFGVAVLAIAFVLMLNLRGTSLDVYLDPIRQIPYVSRLAKVIETSGTGRVRVLIWDAAMELVTPHRPLGIPGSEVARPDTFNPVRPLIGYGPESMFNAFAFVYPPDLAHVEARGSSADRSHNETMDSLVFTGALGFLAFYFLMTALFYHTLNWLGWVPDKKAKWRLIILMLVGAGLGTLIPYLADNTGNPLTFAPVGLPFGLMGGVVAHLLWQGIIAQKEDTDSVQVSGHPLLLIGILGALIGHFVEVHFVFSIAATYTYFWAYAGLLVALAAMQKTPAAEAAETGPQAEAADSEPAFLETKAKQPRRSRRSRSRRPSRKQKAPPAPAPVRVSGSESLETWVSGQGLAMAIILIILTFDFVTPQFQLSFSNKDSLSLLWMFVITWLIGLAITVSDTVIRASDLNNENPNWVRIAAIYAITSFSYFFLYLLAHRVQFGQQMQVANPGDAIKAANVLAYGLVVFYIFLFALLFLMAIMLAWPHMRGARFSRPGNWWLYPPLAVLALVVLATIWFKNINVVRADIYLKEGERYRNANQWSHAIALHEKSRTLDSDEDFYYLMLALDYQLMAQDGNLEPEQRKAAWQQGEQIALQARRINPYNPDNTGNMGRYYFTLGQILDTQYYQKSLEFFEKATTLAPTNVIYHNLWAQTYYILQDYETAISRLETSIELDDEYGPTWLLLGDTYAAMGNVNQALQAHTEAIMLSNDFFDQFLDQRLNFYISAGQGEQIIAVMQETARQQPENARIQWAIGHAYNRQGRPEEALAYLEQAKALGDTSPATLKELAGIYLAGESFDQAMVNYQLVLQNNPNDIETHSALAYLYAQMGRLDEAIQHNQLVLEQIPEDYDSLKNLALLYQQKGQLEQSLAAAQQAQSVAPESEQANWQKFITDIESQLPSSG